MAEPTPQVIIDNNLQAEWTYATELDDQVYLNELLEQAQKLSIGTLSSKGVERPRDPFSATPEMVKPMLDAMPDVDEATKQQFLADTEKKAFPSGRPDTPVTPPQEDFGSGQEGAIDDALQAGTFYAPEYRIQQRLLEEGLRDAELDAFRALRDAYQAEGDSPTVAMRKAYTELSVITGAFYTPAGKMVEEGPAGKGDPPFPIMPEERGAFERQMVESPSQVAERKKQRKAGQVYYDNLKGSFNLEAYDIIFDENDNRRPAAEIERRQREAKVPVDANADFTTVSEQIEDRFKGNDVDDIVRNAINFQMGAQGIDIPVAGDPDYQQYIQAQIAMQNYFMNVVFQEDEFGQSIDPRKATLTDRFVKNLFTTEIDGGVVESQTARGLRVVGGLIRPVSNAIVGGMSYAVDEDGNPLDTSDLNYQLAQLKGRDDWWGTGASYIGFLLPSSRRVLEEGPRESGYLSHDNFIDATLHDIKVGRFLGDDFVSMPFLGEGLGEAFNTDPEAAAMSLGLITEIGLPLTPAGSVGMTMKGVGKPLEIGGKVVGKVPKIKGVGETIESAGRTLSRTGEAVLPENILASSTAFYRLKQTERAIGETGMRGTLSVDEAATPRMTRDFTEAVSDEAGTFSKEKYDRLQPKTPDGERAISEAASLHQEIDDLARNIDNITDDELRVFLDRNPTGAKVLGEEQAIYSRGLGIETPSGPIGVGGFRGMLEFADEVPNIKKAFTYETFNTFLANRLPKDYIFVTPTMVAKQSAYKQIYDDVSTQMKTIFGKFEDVGDGKFIFRGTMEEADVLAEVSFLRRLNLDLDEPLDALQIARLNDSVKEALIEQRLLASGQGGRIGYVSDKAYEGMNVPMERRYQGTITSQALSPMAVSGLAGFGAAGPVGGLIGLAAPALSKALRPLAEVRGLKGVVAKPVGYAAKLADDIIEGVSKLAIGGAERGQERLLKLSRGVGSYFLGKPQITPTMPVEVKRIFEATKAEVRAIPRNLVMEMADDIRAGKDPVAVFESKLAQAIDDNPRYDITIDGQRVKDPIQGDDLFAIDFIRGFFGDDIKFLDDAEILKYGFGGTAVIGTTPLAAVREGIGKLRSRFSQLQNRGFGGKFMGDDFASYSTLFILEGRAKAVFNTKLEEALGQDDFIRLTTREADIADATVSQQRALEVDRFGQEMRNQLSMGDQQIIAAAKQYLKDNESTIIGAGGVETKVQATLPPLLTAQLEGVVYRFREFVTQNANAITKGYFDAKSEALLRAGLDQMVEAVIRGDDYYTIIKNFEDEAVRTLVSQTVVSDVKMLTKELGLDDIREALKMLDSEDTVDVVLRDALTTALSPKQFGIKAEEFLSALERNGLVVNRTTFGKESVRALQPNIIALGESGKVMIGNKLTAQTYDDLVGSFRSGNYENAINSLNTRSLTLGDYAANRVGQFVNGVSRSMRNGLLAGKYIFNGRYLGLNNISQPFIMATTTPNYVGRALQRTLTNVLTLGIDPIALSNALKRAGTALPAGGLATGATVGGLFFGAPIVGGVVGAVAGSALLAKGDLTALLARGYENFLLKNPQTKVPLGVFYGANKMDEVYFTDAFGKRWTGQMIDDAIKRNDIYLTQVSYEFGEDAIEDIVKAARVGRQGKGAAKDIAMEALSYLLPNKKSLANILAEETDLAFRQQVFVAGLGMGLPEDQAAALARASLFDYGGINNKLERDYARRFFLFYAFMRQSGLETTKAMLSPRRAAIIGTQARFAQNQKKTAELDILLQTTPFITQRRKQLASSYAYITNAYQQHFYAVYGPAFPMVESFLQLNDVMSNVAKLNIIDPLLQTAVGASPLTQLASRELQSKRMGASEFAPQGYLSDRDLVAFQQLGVLNKDFLDFFDLEPAEPPSRANITVAGDVEGIPQPPNLADGYRLRFRSAEGAKRYRIMKAIGAVTALDRSIMDYTSSQVVGGEVENLEDIQYRQLNDGNYELYIRGLATPIKVPTYLQMELDILNSQIRDLQGKTKQIKPRRKK